MSSQFEPEMYGWDPAPSAHHLCTVLKGMVEPLSVLDVGCGPGHYSVEIASRGAAEVVGLDFSSTMLELGRRLAAHRTVDDRCTFVEGDLFNYVSAVPFDTVVAMGFFDYVSDAVRTLRHLRSMTEGRVLASFPWRYALRVPARKTWFKIRGCRFWTYTRVEIASACATSGFQVTELYRRGPIYLLAAEATSPSNGHP